MKTTVETQFVAGTYRSTRVLAAYPANLNTHLFNMMAIINADAACSLSRCKYKLIFQGSRPCEIFSWHG